MSIPWTEESVFDNYTILEETFKTVSSHPIRTAILIPKTLPPTPGPRPVIYHLHGGFLVMAHGLFAPFFPKWVDALALEQGAIIVSPDYRLLPSANGVADVLEDLEDGWRWTKDVLPGVLRTRAPGVEMDLSRTLIAGGSAGGYCAIQLALSHPSDFAAAAVVYPLIDLKDHVYTTGPLPSEPTVLRFAPADIPSKSDTLTWLEDKRQKPETRDGSERTPFAVAACTHGLFYSHVLDNRDLREPGFYPLDRVAAGAKFPPRLWIMHGSDDSTVRQAGSDAFVSLARETLPGTEIRYDVVPGEDHGFDFDEARWASVRPAALDFVRQGWLKM